MSYTHLSIIERSQLEMLNRQGWTVRAITKEIGHHHSTVAREIRVRFRVGKSI
jgi:IS30 family transposase